MLTLHALGSVLQECRVGRRTAEKKLTVTLIKQAKLCQEGERRHGERSWSDATAVRAQRHEATGKAENREVSG